MVLQLRLGLVVIFIALLSPIGSAQSLLKYRAYEFGMTVGSVLQQTKMEPASVKTIHATPDLIQTLQWNNFSSSRETDPVRTLRFEFYNNQLFRIVAIYGYQQLEGLNASDLIEAISKVYGAASSPNETIIVSSYAGYEDRQKVLARWENGENSYSLFRSSSLGEFGLIGASKKLDGMAMISIREGERLDALAAPQLEIQRRLKLDEERRAQQEKARSVNMPNFHP